MIDVFDIGIDILSLKISLLFALVEVCRYLNQCFFCCKTLGGYILIHFFERFQTTKRIHLITSVPYPQLFEQHCDKNCHFFARDPFPNHPLQYLLSSALHCITVTWPVSQFREPDSTL